MSMGDDCDNENDLHSFRTYSFWTERGFPIFMFCYVWIKSLLPKSYGSINLVSCLAHSIISAGMRCRRADITVFTFSEGAQIFVWWMRVSWNPSEQCITCAAISPTRQKWPHVCAEPHMLVKKRCAPKWRHKYVHIGTAGEWLSGYESHEGWISCAPLAHTYQKVAYRCAACRKCHPNFHASR